MTDQRRAEELSVEELEEILKRKRQEARVERLRRIASAEGERRAKPPTALASGQDQSGRRWQRPSGPRTMVRPPRGQPGRDRGEGNARAGAHGLRSARVRPLDPDPIQETSNSFLGMIASLWQGHRQRIRDGILLTVELGALVGLIAILFSSFSSLRLLNDEVAEAQRRDAAGAAPTAQAITLPGSSSPPGSGEMPEPYSHISSEGAAIVIPTPGPKQATRIVIPAIDVDSAVVEGDGWEELKKGAGHHLGSANPGEKGNCVISAHNDVFGEIFRDIQNLEPGDEVTVYAGDMPYTYVVRARRVVDPSEVSVMDPTPDPIVTLITCHPYMIDTQRMIVVGELVGSEP